MKGFLKRLHRESKGFTLIELLVVITILGVLAAIVLPNFTGLTHQGEEQAAMAEKITVQTAVDAMMAKNGLSTVAGVVEGSATDNMSTFPDPSYPIYPSFLRQETTAGTYYCSVNGTVSQKTSGFPLP